MGERISMIGNGQQPVRITPEGGLACQMINKTGLASVKGMVIRAGSVDNSFIIAPISSDEPLSIVYENGIADGELTWVVFSGKALVLLQDGIGSTAGHWSGVSDVTAGRIDSVTEPPATVKHDQEVGHVLESKSSGTDVLVLCSLHFR